MVVTRSKAKAAVLAENPSVGKSNNAPTTTKKAATKKGATKKAATKKGATKKAATKKGATKKASKANTTGTSNRRAGEDPPAVDPSLVVDLVEDLDNLDKEDLIAKVKGIFLHLGLQDIHVDLSEEEVNQVRRYFRITGDRLEDEVLRELMKLFLPGYEEKSKSVKKLVDHLRLAVFPAAMLDEIGGANFNNDNNELMPQPAAVVPPTPNGAIAVEDQAVSQRDFTTFILLNDRNNREEREANLRKFEMNHELLMSHNNRLTGMEVTLNEVRADHEEYQEETRTATNKLRTATKKLRSENRKLAKTVDEIRRGLSTVRKKVQDAFTPSPTASSSIKNSGSTSARGLRIKFASSSSSTKKSGKSGNKPSKSPLRKNLFPGGEEEEDAKQQATNENLNIATPAKPISQAGNEVATVHPPAPSPATSAVGSIVVNDDGNDDNLGDDNHGVEVVAQINLRNDDNGGLRVENVAPLNEGGKEEEDSNSKQQAKNENQNIATPNGVEVSFHRNAYRNINDGLDSSPEAGSPMSVDSVNEDEDADAAGNDQGGGILSPTIIQSFGKLSLFSPPSNTN